MITRLVWTKLNHSLTAHLPGERSPAAASSKFSNEIMSLGIGNPPKLSGMHGSLVCARAVVPRQFPCELYLIKLAIFVRHNSYICLHLTITAIKIHQFLCPAHCSVGAYMQSGSIQSRAIPCFGAFTLSTVNMSITCSDSSTHVCHSAIVTDSTLLSVRHIAIVTSNSNPSVCPIAIFKVCYRYLTDAM